MMGHRDFAWCDMIVMRQNVFRLHATYRPTILPDYRMLNLSVKQSVLKYRIDVGPKKRVARHQNMQNYSRLT